MTTSDLPRYVHAVADRHGKTRYRFRRRGVKGGYLPGLPGSPEWHEALASYLREEKPGKAGPLKRHRPYSMDALAAHVRSTLRWKRQAAQTKIVYGRIIERLMEKTNSRGTRFGDRDARQIDVASLERLLGKMSDRPGAAKKMRHVLARLFTQAVKLGWRSDNPAALTDAIPQIGEGHHTWTDDEIEKYRACHALGTNARLVLELALNTAARRCNIATLERSQIRDGLIYVAHVKGGEETIVPLTDEARAAIEAMGATHIRYLIVNAYGEPYSVAGLGMRMRSWTDAAGLERCTLHGLRKAQARRLAENGATNAEGRAVTGHKTDAMFNYYSQKANRKQLADRAFAKLKGD